MTEYKDGTYDKVKDSFFEAMKQENVPVEHITFPLAILEKAIKDKKDPQDIANELYKNFMELGGRMCGGFTNMVNRSLHNTALFSCEVVKDLLSANVQ